MLSIIVPATLLPLLAAFAPCFTVPSDRTFCLLLSGWVHCQGRRTVTGLVIAAGAVGSRHISAFHRCSARARWSLDALGRVVFTPALRWIPADRPLVLLGDDTLAREGGRGSSLATMHHAPLLSSAREPFCSFGHVWAVLAVWVPLPLGSARGFALPILFRPYVGARRGGQADAPGRPRKGVWQRAAEAAHAAHPRPPKRALRRELIGPVAAWAGERTVSVVVDRAHAGRTLLEAMAATLRRRDPLPITIDGRQVTPPVFGVTALWYGALRDQPVRIGAVRDPSGRRRDEAFFCTDLSVGPAFIVAAYAGRWTLEVSLHDQTPFLGFEDPQQQTGRAVARTAPVAGLVSALVLLWSAERAAQGPAPGWVARPWYRAKTAPSFLDLLTALRQDSRPPVLSAPPCPPRRLKKPAQQTCNPLATAA